MASIEHLRKVAKPNSAYLTSEVEEQLLTIYMDEKNFALHGDKGVIYNNCASNEAEKWTPYELFLSNAWQAAGIVHLDSENFDKYIVQSGGK